MPRIFALVLALGLVIALAAPAGATIHSRGTDSWEEEWVEDGLCDFPFTIAETGDSRWRIREGKGPHEQAFFLHVVARVTWVGTAGDRSVTVTEQWLFNEVRATPLGDGVFRFSDVTAGPLLTVRDASGKVLLMERGAVRASYDFDTLNDSAPGGDFLGNFEESLHGRFQGDRFEEVVCSALAPPGA